MSAISSNAGDREDALRRAQRAHEPSMEEILASIRSIIADERDAGRAVAPKPAPSRAATAPGPQIVYSKTDPPARPGTDPVATLVAAKLPESAQPKIVSRQPETASTEAEPKSASPAREPNSAPLRDEPKSAPPPEEPKSVPPLVHPQGAPTSEAITALVPTDEPLLSAQTGAATAAAFQALTAKLAERNAELADGMVRDLLRPMLKAWLDENLPGMVERLVGAEIERLARGPL
jgi:uncharacterized protein